MSLTREHYYELTVKWTGNTGTGTSSYRVYKRDHVISANNKADILCSAEAAFHGDNTKYNPEEFLVASLSTCHMLWFFHLCADAGVVVVDYTDTPHGVMEEFETGGGKFIEVTLNPMVTVKEKAMIEKVNELHKKANQKCFIANSCNFPVHHKPTCLVANN
jgi:organic hydroperoxide reductase OsmC/OhrA